MNTVVKRAWLVALFLLGTMSGAGLALRATWILEIRSGEHDLLRYGGTILHILETGAIEAGHTGISVTTDNLRFCSDDELALMRRLVYGAAFVKDIGRVKDGTLYCSSSLGRLPHPVKEPAADLSLQRPEAVSPVEIASGHQLSFAPGPDGIVVFSAGVAEVINPSLFGQLDDPPKQFTGLFYDHEHQTLLYGAGHTAALPTPEILAQKVIQRGGVIYQPLCSDHFPVCVIAQEPVSAMTGKRTGFVVAGAVGALLGMSLVSTVILLFQRQRSLEQRLRRAIRGGKLFCVYQPIVSLETGAVVGAEALARWTNEQGEEVSPGVFIPIAEEAGFVGEVTRLAMDRVVEDMRALLGGPEFRVSINITAQDLADAAFYSHLAGLVARSGIAREALAFELTERSRIDQEAARKGIAWLRSAGHPIYIDDFGTGYSSLSYLHDLEVDAIKIDRMFTHTIGTESVIGVVLPQIVYAASRLGLTVVVEGVETEDQADYFCRAASGILGQGYLLGRPVPAAEFKQRLALSLAEGPAANNGAGTRIR